MLANSGVIGIFTTFTPGTHTYTITGSTVEYNSTTADQALPSSGFNTYNNLTINNTKPLGGVVTGFLGLTVNGLLDVKAGTFTSSSTYNNVQIAKMTSDTDTHGDWALNKQCWQGAHAHEDTYHKSSDSIVSTQKGFWSFNDLKSFGKKGVSFPINSSNWTRQLEYDF